MASPGLPSLYYYVAHLLYHFAHTCIQPPSLGPVQQDSQLSPICWTTDAEICFGSIQRSKPVESVGPTGKCQGMSHKTQLWIHSGRITQNTFGVAIRRLNFSSDLLRQVRPLGHWSAQLPNQTRSLL